MTKAVTYFLSVIVTFCFLAAPIAISVADEPTQKVEVKVEEVKKEESKGVWGWIKEKVVWVGTAIKDGVVWVGTTIGDGFMKVWHWIWPKKEDKGGIGVKTSEPMKMSTEKRPMY